MFIRLFLRFSPVLPRFSPEEAALSRGEKPICGVRGGFLSSRRGACKGRWPIPPGSDCPPAADALHRHGSGERAARRPRQRFARKHLPRAPNENLLLPSGFSSKPKGRPKRDGLCRFYFFSGCTRWQATKWPGVISCSGGLDSLHWSQALGQRPAKLQPLGVLMGLGTSPEMIIRCF